MELLQQRAALELLHQYQVPNLYNNEKRDCDNCYF